MRARDVYRLYGATSELSYRNNVSAWVLQRDAFARLTGCDISLAVGSSYSKGVTRDRGYYRQVGASSAFLVTNAISGGRFTDRDQMRARVH